MALTQKSLNQTTAVAKALSGSRPIPGTSGLKPIAQILRARLITMRWTIYADFDRDAAMAIG